MAGTFNTSYVTNLNLRLLELNHTAEFNVNCKLTKELLYYDIILGRYILHELGIIYNFQNKTVTW